LPREYGKGLPNPLLNAVELRTGIASGITMCKLGSERRRTFGIGKPAKLANKLWKLSGKKTQRRRLARSDCKSLLAVEIHLTVTAEPTCVDIDGFNHCSPPPDHGSFVANDRAASDDYRDIGGRTTHIRDSEVLEAAEKACAHDARGGTGQYRLNGIFERHLCTHQGPIALHDHQRR
jgi:hypothetical protein